MEILKLLQERHTTKKYDASRKISDADFDLLLESLRLAPSSVNSQPWEFFIADTKEAKEKLLPAIADFNHSRVTDSDRLIVCAIHTDLDETYMQDLDDQEEADGRYQDPAYKVDNGQRRRFFVGKYRDAGEIACWAGKQAYIAQGFLLYTAAALGIHSTPIEGWDADKVDEILGLREKGMHAQYAVALGYGAADDHNAARPKSRWALAKVRPDMHIRELIQLLDSILDPSSYRDYAPNGLQVQGSRDVKRLVTGVTASLDLIEAAAAQGADAILVHHGWFWKGEEARITGIRYQRISRLIESGMHLIGYHLPLDDHPEIGNNALLGKALGLSGDMRFGDYGWSAPCDCAITVPDLADRLETLLNRKPLVLGPQQGEIRRIGWCTGAAQDLIEEAAAIGCDCFISGEVSERTFHQAKELGITYFACGHHATERFGVRALGERIATETDIDVTFIDIDNPV